MTTKTEADRKRLDEALATVDGEAILQRIAVLVAGGGADEEQALYDAAYHHEREARKASPQTRDFILGVFYGASWQGAG